MKTTESQSMNALVKSKSERGIWLERVAVPEPGPTDVRVRVRKTAICGTDLHIYRWDEWARRTIPVPLVTGHEFVGVIESIGSAVKGLQVGMRVSAEGHITCGTCRNCRAGKQHLCRNTVGVGVQRPGAFADFIVVPATNIFPISDTISDDIAAIFDPLGNAVHTALSFDLVGEDVLITGAGPIGIMAVRIARHVGARHVVITDINQSRLDLATDLGASRAINPMQTDIRSTMKDLGMREGFDVGLEMSGNAQAFTSLLGAMNHGGRVALLGIFPENVAIDWSQVVFKGLHIKGIYGREMYETWYKMTSMLESGLNVGPVITHTFPFDQYLKGFDLLDRGDAVKVILDWDHL